MPGFLCDYDKKRIGSNQSNRLCAVSLARTEKSYISNFCLL